MINDALHAGLPCVATNVGNHTKIIFHGENGSIADRHEDRNLGEACISILKDEELFAKLSSKAQTKAAKNLVPKRQIAKYIELYRMLI